MKTSKWLKLEIVTMSLGLIAVVFANIGLHFWQSLSADTQNFFRGGEPGAILLGVLVILGIVSTLLLIVNLVSKRYTLWWLRTFGMLLFYFGAVKLGQFV